MRHLGAIESSHRPGLLSHGRRGRQQLAVHTTCPFALSGHSERPAPAYPHHVLTHPVGARQPGGVSGPCLSCGSLLHRLPLHEVPQQEPPGSLTCSASPSLSSRGLAPAGQLRAGRAPLTSAPAGGRRPADMPAGAALAFRGHRSQSLRAGPQGPSLQPWRLVLEARACAGRVAMCGLPTRVGWQCPGGRVRTRGFVFG